MSNILWGIYWRLSIWLVNRDLDRLIETYKLDVDTDTYGARGSA